MSFSDVPATTQFYADVVVKKRFLHGLESNIGYREASLAPSWVAFVIQQCNTSKNAYLGGLDENENATEEQLRGDLGRFSLIDQVKTVRDKDIRFVRLLGIPITAKVLSIILVI